MGAVRHGHDHRIFGAWSRAEIDVGQQIRVGVLRVGPDGGESIAPAPMRAHDRSDHRKSTYRLNHHPALSLDLDLSHRPFTPLDLNGPGTGRSYAPSYGENILCCLGVSSRNVIKVGPLMFFAYRSYGAAPEAIPQNNPRKVDGSAVVCDGRNPSEDRRRRVREPLGTREDFKRDRGELEAIGPLGESVGRSDPLSRQLDELPCQLLLHALWQVDTDKFPAPPTKAKVHSKLLISCPSGGR